MPIDFLSLKELPPLVALEHQLSPVPWTLTDFESSLSAGHIGFVMRSGSHIVGYAIISAVLDEAEVLLIGIASEYQRQGFGSKLWTHIQAYLTEKNIKKIFLEVRESNTKAISFYNKIGFREVSRRVHYYQCADGYEDAVVMCVIF